MQLLVSHVTVIWLWAGHNVVVDPSLVGIGEFTQFRTDSLVVGLNRMFTGGTIWILTHGHMALALGLDALQPRSAFLWHRPTARPQALLFFLKYESLTKKVFRVPFGVPLKTNQSVGFSTMFGNM